MHPELTPAAQRAVAAAFRWAAGSGRAAIDEPCLLLGLLHEPECRAAVMLARRSIDASAVIDRWPDYRDSSDSAAAPNGGDAFSPELAAAVRSVEQRLDNLPPPLALASEHLLLALVDSSSDAGRWLRERGFSTAELVAEIYRAHGVEPGPVDVDLESNSPLSAPETNSPSGPAGATSAVPSGMKRRSAVTVTRILDAGANRALEALRVVEDYLRFGLDDGHLTGLAKQIRHDLTAALAALPLPARLAARQTEEDVGTAVSTSAELTRKDAAHVAQANFSRLAEALRSLEEFTKIDRPDMSPAIEQLRYRVYTLQRAAGITFESRARWENVRLYVLLDGRASLDDFRALACELAAAGVDALQLRDKQLDDRALLQRAAALREITADTDIAFIMNDRPDLAVLAAADGVHVGQDDLSVRDVRKIVGVDMLVGVSTHNIDQARRAVIDGASYIGVGPTFPSGTKQFPEFAGLEFIRQVAAEISLPAFAIGGIDAGNAPQVLDAGLSRLAVSGAVLNSRSPALACRELARLLAPSRA